MSVIRFEEQRPKLERMASHWPRNIQEYWRLEEERRMSLPAKLISETIRLSSGPLNASTKFGKRKSYVVPPLGIDH